MDPALLSTIFAIGGTIAAGGAAYGGVRYGLNGMRESQARIEAKLDKLDGQVQMNRIDIAAIKAVDRIANRG